MALEIKKEFTRQLTELEQSAITMHRALSDAVNHPDFHDLEINLQNTLAKAERAGRKWL